MSRNPMGMDPCDTQNDAIFNSMTEKRNNVQLRTGLFEACVPLPRIVGNVGFGPEVDMSLLYTPVVNNFAALGDGWSFAFTTYHAASKQLTLHSGEVLEVDEGKELKTAAVIARWKDSGATLEVERKDGRVETLKKQGLSQLWAPERLTADGYRYVALTWSTVAQIADGKTHFQLRLAGIRNDTPAAATDPDAVKAEVNRQLVTVAYEPAKEPTSVTITFWPGTNETLQYVLAIDDVALRSVTPPEGPGWESRFEYKDDVDCGWLLTSILTFDGLTETVEYVPETRTFPNDPKLEKLPCVCKHTVKPRGGSPDVVTEYAYVQNHDDPNVAYTTTVTERARSGGRTTTYVYDSSHSMVSEMTVRGDCTITRSFRHEAGEVGAFLSRGLDPDRAPEQGVFTRTTETRFSRGSAFRVERSSTLFRGGIVDGVVSKGVTTRLEFGGEGAFADVYLLRELSPYARKETSYTTITGLNRKRLGLSLLFPTASTPIRQEITYCDEAGFTSGLKKCIRQGLAEAWTPLASGVGSTTYDYTCEGTGLTVTTIEIRGDGSQTTSQTVSILSGRQIREVDAAGNQSEHTYDARTGRLVSTTVCKGSAEYEEVTRYSYPSVGRVEIVEPDGRKRAAESDGRDNVIMEAVSGGATGEASSDDIWITLSTLAHDDLGRKVAATRYDVADHVSIRETCTFGYDNWGQECRQTYGDGRSIFNEFNPVTLMRDEWEGAETDKHRKRTYYNVDDSLLAMRWLDAEGEAYMGQGVSYRGGRPEKVIASDGTNVKQVASTYDALGRLVRQGIVVFNASIRLTPTLPTNDNGCVVSDEDQELFRPDGPLTNESHSAVAYSYRTDDFLSHDPTEIRFADSATRGERTLGKREFDAWGRVTSLTRAGITEMMTYKGTLPVPSWVTSADGTSLVYEYVPELAYRPSKVSGVGTNTKTLTYVHGKTRQSSAKEGSAGLTCDHDLNERVAGARASVSTGVSRDITQRWSEGGRLLSEADAVGGVTTYTYNTRGQRIATRRGTTVATDHAYDALGRLASEDITHGSDKARVEYAYDAMHREITRRFTLPGNVALTLSREYFPGGRVKSVALARGATVLGSKRFTYDVNGRLASCTMTDSWRPKNPKGKPIDSQGFINDALGNVTRCITRFGTEVCNSTYTYDESGCRLSKLEHDHADYRPSATLIYDSNGRLTKDASGKTFAYDWLGRLVRAGSRHYTYDGMDRLMTCGTSTEKRQLVYDGMSLRGEHGTGDTGRYFYPGSVACSIQRVKLSGVDRTLFELSDADGTVLVSYDLTAKTFKHHAFTAYGEHTSDEADSLLGFQGAYRDTEAASGQDSAVDRYPLGQGYRWYLPGQMQFHGPDSESPYGVGGLHAYGYCDGDPVNAADPSGHSWFTDAFSWVGNAVKTVFSYTPLGLLLGEIDRNGPDWLKKTVKIGESVLIGVGAVAGAFFTGGTSLLLLGVAVTLATVSAVTGIVATVLEESSPETAAILNWISFGTGLGSGLATSAAAAKLGSLARQGSKWIQGVARGGLRGAGRTSVRGAAKAAGKSTRQIVDDALGALKPESTSTKLYNRAIAPLKPYLKEVSLFVVEGVTGALGNAGVFESESMAEAANKTAGRTRVTLALASGDYNLTDSIAGRMGNAAARSRPRLRFR